MSTKVAYMVIYYWIGSQSQGRHKFNKLFCLFLIVVNVVVSSNALPADQYFFWQRHAVERIVIRQFFQKHAGLVVCKGQVVIYVLLDWLPKSRGA